MCEPPEIYRWTLGEVAPDIARVFKITNLSDLQFSVSDFAHVDLHPYNIISTSIGPLDLANIPMNLSSFSYTSFADEIAISDISHDDPSTQIVRSSSEIIVDVEDIEQYKTKFTNSLLQLIHEEIFEYGMENAADEFVQDNLRDYSLYTKECLGSMLLKHFANVGVLTGLLRIISHIDYEDISPIGQTMALAVLNHENVEVRECGIRAFENWGNIESLNILRHIKCKEKWLQDYLEKVIIDLEELNVPFSQKTQPS